jgi:hypothetical protein
VLIEQDNRQMDANVNRAGQSDRPSQGRRAPDEHESDFALLISTMQRTGRPNIEIARGEDGLDKQMFESPPADARSRNLAESRKDMNKAEPGDPRTLRFDRAKDSATGSSHTNVSSPLLQDRSSALPGDRIPNGAVDVARPAGSHAESHVFAPGLEGSGRGPYGGSESKASVELTRMTNGVDHHTAASTTASASMSNAGASISGAESISSAANARQPSVQTPAQQVGQVLRAGLNSQTESARSVAGPDSRTESHNPGQSRTQSHQEGRFPAKSNETSSTTGSGRSDRVTEPTPFYQLVRSIRLRTGDKISSARMQLDPPELGRMRVDVRVVGDRAEIQVRTETPEAAYRLHGRAIELKAALEQHGIRVDRFDVEVEAFAFESFSPGSNGSGHANVKQGAGESTDGPLRWGSDPARDAQTSPWFEPDLTDLWHSAQWFNVAERRVDVRV